jgi:hypothetical protein
MKTKESIDFTQASLQKLPKTKQKSLKPMRSLIAVRSLRPKTSVALIISKEKDDQSTTSL